MQLQTRSTPGPSTRRSVVAPKHRARLLVISLHDDGNGDQHARRGHSQNDHASAGANIPKGFRAGWAQLWSKHAKQFSIVPFALAGGNGGGFTGGSGGGGGGGGGDGGGGGMKCGGCVGHVKKLLEQQEGVTQASVNLATETALVHVLVPKGSDDRGQMAKQLEEMAERISQAMSKTGFKTTIRSSTSSSSAVAAVLAAKRESKIQRMHEGRHMGSCFCMGPVSSPWHKSHEGFVLLCSTSSSSAVAAMLATKKEAKMQRMRDATWDLAFAWGLSLLSGFAHLGHAWVGAPKWLHALHSPPLQAALSVLALVGPGRNIICSGANALWNGRPDMNTLVGLGATASFGVSCVAAMLPNLGWKTFFEEPAMLLVLQTGGYKEVPADIIGSGDLITVLPGDRVPVDGIVTSGRSTVDESAITGEPLPITKQKGDKVTAGTVNCNGQVTVQAEHSGQQTVIADIVRLVEMAQARTAPIQRLADSVAGKFAYGVIGLSVATFAFWALAGTRMFPQVLVGATQAGSAAAAACAACLTGGAAVPSSAAPIAATASLILSAQMACNVLVTACPCALGLATPTAVLVGTGAGARRGLLIRGGDVLEAISHIAKRVLSGTENR
eukprot:gene17695-24051_t